MNWKKTTLVGVALAISLGAGCASCKDDNNESNNTNNNQSNNTTGNNTTGNNQNNNNGTNNTTGSNNGTLDCANKTPLEITAITEDTVIEKGGTCYVSEGLTVSAKLTIEPGVVIEFAENAEIRVTPEGKITADGTAEEPIILTASEPIRGYWRGITLERSNSLSNIFNYVTIEYAGGSGAPAAFYANTCCMTAASFEMSNSTIRQSASLGMKIEGEQTIRKFDENVITENEKGAASFSAWSLQFVNDTNDFSGNDVELVSVEGNLDEVGDIAWPGLASTYRFENDLLIQGETHLTIGAGATLEFASGTQIRVVKPASLSAVGEDGSPVTFTGIEKSRGFWNGILFEQTDDPANSLDWAIVEYAGGGQALGGVRVETCCSLPATASITNSIIRESEDYGIYVQGEDVTATMFENNTITANAKGAVSINAKALNFLGASDYSGNDVDIVHVRGEVIETEIDILNPGVPYRVTDTRVEVRAPGKLTLAPGTVMEFASGVRLTFTSGGIANMVGTAAEPIVLKGQEDMPGYWYGLELERTSDPLNVLDYVEIRNGGSGTSTANLALKTCCMETLGATLQNLTIDSGSKAGIHLAAGNMATNPVNLTGCQNITITNTAEEVSGDVASLAELQALCQ